MSVCMHACMHACMYIYIYVYIYILCVCMRVSEIYCKSDGCEKSRVKLFFLSSKSLKDQDANTCHILLVGGLNPSEKY